MRRTWDHPAYPRPRDSPVTSSLRLSTSGWLAPRECLACLLDRFWFSPRHSPFTPALGSRSATRSSREECTSVVHFSNFPTRSTGRLLRGGMAPVSLHFRPFSPPCENWNENFYHRGTCHSRRMRFPRADIISTRNRVVGSNRCARSFLSFFLFHEWNERGRLHLRILRVLRFIISRRCVCVCARVHVSCTRERDIRAYVRVALICAHFTIIVRDRIVVGWRLCPALLRQLFCYSDGVRVFVLNGAHHLSPRHVIRFSWSVPPERVTTLKVMRPRQPRPIQHAVSLLRTRRTCLLSSLRFKGSWNEIVSKGKETI